MLRFRITKAHFLPIILWLSLGGALFGRFVLPIVFSVSVDFACTPKMQLAASPIPALPQSSQELKWEEIEALPSQEFPEGTDEH